MLRKTCRIRADSEQELHIGIVCITRRTAPFARVSVQAGFGSPALTLMVPVGGFEVKVKQVSLQPASDVPNSVDAQNRSTQTPGRRDRAFSAKVCAIGHRQTGGPSYKEIFYAEAVGAAFLFGIRPRQQILRLKTQPFIGDMPNFDGNDSASCRAQNSGSPLCGPQSMGIRLCNPAVWRKS